ncbi:MAG: hypothetical protein ACRDHY_16255, partial [Anaerolineales bacterium]
PKAIRDGVNRGLSVSLTGSAAPAGERRYNPGGVVPEVAQPASWGSFALILALLAALLFVPALVRMAAQIPGRVREARSSSGTAGRGDGRRTEASRAKGRVRLKPPRNPRVKIR